MSTRSRIDALENCVKSLDARAKVLVEVQDGLRQDVAALLGRLDRLDPDWWGSTCGQWVVEPPKPEPICTLREQGCGGEPDGGVCRACGRRRCAEPKEVEIVIPQGRSHFVS